MTYLFRTYIMVYNYLTFKIIYNINLHKWLGICLYSTCLHEVMLTAVYSFDTDVTSGTGTAYSTEVLAFTPVYHGFVLLNPFCVLLCRLLLVLFLLTVLHCIICTSANWGFYSLLRHPSTFSSSFDIEAINTRNSDIDTSEYIYRSTVFFY